MLIIRQIYRQTYNDKNSSSFNLIFIKSFPTSFSGFVNLYPVDKLMND